MQNGPFKKKIISNIFWLINSNPNLINPKITLFIKFNLFVKYRLILDTINFVKIKISSLNIKMKPKIKTQHILQVYILHIILHKSWILISKGYHV